MLRLHALIVAMVSLSLPAMAQRWETPKAAGYRGLGIVAARMVSGGDNSVIDAIACNQGQARLIVAGTGGEPPQGPVTVSIGGRTATLTFVRDAAIGRGIGLDGSAAALPAEHLSAFKDATSIRYGFRQQPVPLSGLKALWSRIEKACGVTTASAGGTNDTTAGGAGQDFAAGRYRGQFTGQTMILRKLSATSYAVKFDVTASGCIGEVEATAALSSDKLEVSRGSAGGGGANACRLTISRQERGLKVVEHDCSVFHGMRCGFDGVYSRR